jgi:hypothetical protein
MNTALKELFAESIENDFAARWQAAVDEIFELERGNATLHVEIAALERRNNDMEQMMNSSDA